MNRSGLSDTIAAIATAQGSAGVGIVRISGDAALTIADNIFSGKKPSQTAGGRFLFGKLLGANSEVIDEGLCLIFRAPHSYTGEDVVELQTHGSPAVLAMVLSRVIELGARLARPGEFTLRAYVAGKLDLAQAEAVLSLINAGTETARRQSALGLGGELSRRVGSISGEIVRTLSAIQAMLDYPEEGVPEEDRLAPLIKAEQSLKSLLDTAGAGEFAARGARLALIGLPNAGKSSLLNALLGYERSIVTPVEGTTRDYLEAGLEIAGIPITLIDTAGIRATTDQVEAAGVRQSRSLAENADLVIILEDGSRPRQELELPNNLAGRVIFVKTKSDLPALWLDKDFIAVSAQNGSGLAELRSALIKMLLGDASSCETWLNTKRQADAARRALVHLEAAKFLPDDLASYELEEALQALAEITGRNVQEDVIDAVFSNFCVGK